MVFHIIQLEHFLKVLQKLNTEKLSTDTIKKYRACYDLPMCIIGGLDKNNIDSAIEYQPDMIAISNGIFGQKKIKYKIQ